MKINRKVALITGASSGIGAATAVEFAKHGVKLSICGRNKQNLEKTATKCYEAGLEESQVLQLLGDVTDEEVCKELVDKTLNHFGELDVLVNNAGTGQPINVLDATSKDLDEMIDVHVKAPFNITQRALPAIIKSKGSIVFLSSLLQLKPATFGPCYSMAKSAVVAYCKALALALADKGVTVNAVCPAMVYTNILGDLDSDQPKFNGMIPRQAIEHYSTIYNYNKKVITAEVVAETIVFLTSTSAEMINGVSLPIDGGSAIA